MPTAQEDWQIRKQAFTARLDTLNTIRIEGKIANLNNDIASYIQTGGLNQEPTTNPLYQRIQTQIADIKTEKTKYNNLHDDINAYLTSIATQNNLNGYLSDNKEIQTTIRRLEANNKTLQTEVDTALARDELLRSRDIKRNAHSLFIMDRPLKKTMIPVLWAISVAFIGLALVIVKMYSPLSITFEQFAFGFAGALMLFFTDRIVLGSLVIISIIVIIFLSLKIANVI
jgi:hypothetical protein